MADTIARVIRPQLFVVFGPAAPTFEVNRSRMKQFARYIKRHGEHLRGVWNVERSSTGYVHSQVLIRDALPPDLVEEAARRAGRDHDPYAEPTVTLYGSARYFLEEPRSRDPERFEAYMRMNGGKRLLHATRGVWEPYLDRKAAEKAGRDARVRR